MTVNFYILTKRLVFLFLIIFCISNAGYSMGRTVKGDNIKRISVNIFGIVIIFFMIHPIFGSGAGT